MKASDIEYKTQTCWLNHLYTLYEIFFITDHVQMELFFLIIRHNLFFFSRKLDFLINYCVPVIVAGY